MIVEEPLKLCVWNFVMEMGYNIPKILCEILWENSYQDGVGDNTTIYDKFNTYRSALSDKVF
jgi:hypothetical protein